MSQFEEINSNGSDASENANNKPYWNLIYNSNILNLEIYQLNNLECKEYIPYEIENLKIKFKYSNIELDRNVFTDYIFSMLNNRLIRVRQESIDFIREFNFILFTGEQYV